MDCNHFTRFVLGDGDGVSIFVSISKLISISQLKRSFCNFPVRKQLSSDFRAFSRKRQFAERSTGQRVKRVKLCQRGKLESVHLVLGDASPYRRQFWKEFLRPFRDEEARNSSSERKQRGNKVARRKICCKRVGRNERKLEEKSNGAITSVDSTRQLKTPGKWMFAVEIAVHARENCSDSSRRQESVKLPPETIEAPEIVVISNLERFLRSITWDEEVSLFGISS